VYIEDLTWPEVKAAIAAGKTTAIIYAGSTEQNGTHLALGNTTSSRTTPRGRSRRNSATLSSIRPCRSRRPAHASGARDT
jgi:hypothetical protein